MIRLTLLLFTFIGATLAGSLIVAALTMGYDTLVPIVVAGAIGFAVALPVAWVVARKLAEEG